jgi:flagellar hook-length control protein FliK
MALRLSTADVPVLQVPVDEVAPQIVQTLRVAWSRGAGEAQIRLDPRQFGDLTVSLRVESGQVVARVQADQPAVREWLQTNQRALQAGLAEHQLRLGRLEVVAPGDEARDAADSQGRRREEPADEPAARRPRRRESTGTFEVVA